MLIYETPIKFFQYFIAALSCFYIIPIYFSSIYWNTKGDAFLYFIGISFFILAIVQFLYMLKNFQIYEEYLTVKRPYFFKSFNHTFQKDSIEKIVFKISATKIGGGINLVVYQKTLITSFQVNCTKQSLKELISNLENADINVDVVKNLKLD
ncbi:hypothetical protein SAMN05660845_0767 [Flavobacterium swingsii]|jgi:hypothetical protein|uniref:PH domain-containing protein n=2 Tax=Flavobacterium swingsii TaxID=498292 RepID=A0A1I0WIK2_9FLAO|nr:hypothetical protein SAMN05660845_0767 [Flavobacterium swingsii]